MTKPLTAGEKIARDLCEMDAPMDNIIEVDPVDVARRIDEEVFHLVETITTLQSKSAALVDALEAYPDFGEYFMENLEATDMKKAALAAFKGEK